MRKANHPFTPAVVGERYEFVRKIGAGAYGTVFEAKDRELGRRVAVKVLDLDDSDVAMREGKALAEFHHDHVVAIFDHGVGPDFRYFVLQYVEGPPLHLWCRDNTTAEPIVGKYIEAGTGLAAIHAKGLVHGDFKPANVRVGPNGKAVVLDFGLARHQDTLERDAEETAVFRGTLDYAPPERLLGKAGDDRSDQFSLCVALWEALSGVNPFGACKESTTIETRLLALAFGVMGTPRGSRRVKRALRRGLSLRPEDRFPSMPALIDALAPRRWRWTWRELLVMGVAVVLVAVVLTQLMPLRGGTSFEFVASARASWSGQVAVAAARDGDVGRALQWLDLAERSERSEESSRSLAVASEAVALEFERRILYPDAVLAWFLTVRFARDGGNTVLERRAQQRIYAAGSTAAISAPR